MNANDFNKKVFPLILEGLSKQELHRTKTYQKPNWVKVCGSDVYVKTNRSAQKYERIRHNYFVSTWEILCRQGKVTQRELSNEHHIKRSAFMLIAFSLLDCVKYDSDKNALVMSS